MLNHGYTEPIRYQQTTKTKGVQIKNLLPTSSQQEKNPEKARGLQVPTTEKYIFLPSSFLYQKRRGSGATLNECKNCTRCTERKRTRRTSRQKDPLAFLCQTAEARGLHSLSALFSAKVHISQKKNQRRPSQDFTSRRTRIKSTTTRPLKLNHEMLGGLSMGNPTGPP